MAEQQAGGRRQNRRERLIWRRRPEHAGMRACAAPVQITPLPSGAATPSVLFIPQISKSRIGKQGDKGLRRRPTQRVATPATNQAYSLFR